MKTNNMRRTANTCYCLIDSDLCITGGYKPGYSNGIKPSFKPGFEYTENQHLDAPAFYQAGHMKFKTDADDVSIYNVEKGTTIVVRHLRYIDGR